MAKYIKQEMPDIAGKGKHQVYYRMQAERNIGAAEFVEERLARALDFIEEHTVMRVAEYVKLTGLSRTTATTELRELCQDPASGIRSMGQRASKVYIKR